MKRALLTATILAIPVAALPLAAQAQPVTGPYVSLGAGADFLQNEISQSANGYGLLPRTYVFDPGMAAFASAGYGLGNGLRLEIEGDYAYNHVRRIKTPFPLEAGGNQQQYGGFLNALYDFDVNLPIFPYLGIGVGYQQVETNFRSSVPGVPFSGGGGYSSRGNFAYQGIAGLSYPLAFVPGLSLTAEYRFIGVQPVGGYPDGRTQISNIFNHEAVFGLRYALFQPAPPPPPAPPMAAPVPAPAPARTYLVFFDWDRADLTARARQIIAEAASASTRVQVTRIEVNGYTDLSGTPQYNQGLSVRRADAVAAELVRDGVPRGAITTQGFGETHPLVPTAQGVREPQNRRVEIILH